MGELSETTSTELMPTTDTVLDPMVSMIERVAMDPNSDLQKLERMLELKERHDAQNARAAYASDFAMASASFPSIPLNGKGHNGKPYATLKDITSGTRPILTAHGLALTFAIDTSGQTIIVTAKLMHKLGHVETTSISLPTDTSGSKNAVQAIGSSQTYGQRYTAQAILGLSLGDDTEDDAASTPNPEKYPSWAETIIQDLPPTATPRDKAEAITAALEAQFRRMKGKQQLMNEWDRRSKLAESLEEKHPDLHNRVVDAYELKMQQITGQD